MSQARIGGASVRTTYRRTEQAFHPSDAPPAAHIRRQEVKQLRRPAALGEKARAAWNGSTAVDRKPCDRQAATLHAFDRRDRAYNYRAEALPSKAAVDTDAFGRTLGSSLRRTARAAEMEVNPALAGKPAWDDRTLVADGTRTREQLTKRLDETARKSTGRRRAAVKGYVGPVERERQRMRLLRAQRAAAATAQLEGSAEFGAAAADSRAVTAMRAAGLGLVSGDPEVSTGAPSQSAFGLAVSASRTRA